ncbi:barwin-like endoglucanase [Coniochaeta ligniaria NRRL 30616]|uniref:cellulase n=1 Tax=Coniochaeta ligniaria NRRL 30616 TaxID=1408157 RepID=A0A1J7JLJ6_9PEZI|nr:barwin-like endoglucanase [Coniochaeta ligniaria NRRL 30616]
MRVQGIVALSLAAGVLEVNAAAAAPAANVGSTLTSWDCCKPACAWTTNLRKAKASGSVAVCDKSDNPLTSARGASATSGCDKSGTGFLCSDYAPRPVSGDLSLGFAITNNVENCCKCFELFWTDGGAAGKRMQVQIINSGGSVDGGRRQFIILSPGGGVGPNTAGCDAQFGYDWGRQYGGVTQREGCESLPDNLQGGCYWRWNWANGEVNGWNVTYNQISCPDALTSVSGCSN